MPKHLLIVESPAKAKTINKYLGKDYTVLASYGHVRDLIPKEGAVDPDNGFAMHYDVIEKNEKHVDAIAKAAKGADDILLATDPDRERYLAWAKGIMSSLTKHYLMGKEEKGNGLLKHSVYHLASNKGVDECASWGDYFYVEALVRFTQSWKLYW